MSRIIRRYALLAAALLGIASLFAMGTGASASTARPKPAMVRGPVRITHAAANVSPDAAAHTAVTFISYRPDSGGNGYDLYDFFTRTITITRAGGKRGYEYTGGKWQPYPSADCGFAVPYACYFYRFSVTDSKGVFETIIGEDSPGLVSAPFQVVEQGTMSGTASGSLFDTYKNAYTADVATAENDNGNVPAGDHTTADWAEQFFGGAGYPASVTLNPWSWSYAVPAGADGQCPAGSWHWTDASTSGDGALAADGNIYAPAAAACAATPNT